MNDLANVDSYSDANRNSYVVHSKKIIGYKYCYNLFLDMGASHLIACKLHI